ncbi:MAG: hypothetical protein INQ03_25345 [Candidatus Heimdallarchaeota archaeon]|nr:hypothetical protein [Candidatus Heimdallarchaeota archaeon]
MDDDYIRDVLKDIIDKDIDIHSTETFQGEIDGDIDEDLLQSILDEIIVERTERELPPKRQNKKESSPILINTLYRMFNHPRYWNQRSDDLANRLHICYECEHENCQHIHTIAYEKEENLLDLAIQSCEHNPDGIMTCIECIKQAAKRVKKQERQTDILLLWDEADLNQFLMMEAELLDTYLFYN